MALYPPRLGHLLTKPVLIAKLTQSYSQAHEIDDEEAASRLSTALNQRFLEELLAATWKALLGSVKRLDEAGLLEKVASTLKDRPLRAGRLATPSVQWSAFLLLVDIHAGTASDAVRRVLETTEGAAKLREGLEVAGKFIAAEVTRK
jgi:hypothetical protein